MQTQIQIKLTSPSNLPASSIIDPPYTQEFLRGLETHGGSRNVNHYKYAGGSQGRHEKYYRLQSTDKDLKFPDSVTKCMCGHTIKENCYIKNILTGQFVVLGNCCIKKFIPKAGRTCDECAEPHKNRNYNMCNPCIDKLPYGKNNFDLKRKYSHIQKPTSIIRKLTPTIPLTIPLNLPVTIQSVKYSLIPWVNEYYRPPDTIEEELRASRLRHEFLLKWRTNKLVTIPLPPKKKY